jgi:inner membrane protein
MPWWAWILFGLILVGVEAATTTLHVGFFGAGAVVVGILVGAGVLDPPWAQWLAFTIVSVSMLGLLRRPLLRRFKLDVDSDHIDAITGETAIALEEIAPNGMGRAELRGSTWSARNSGERKIDRGDRCVVERVEGLTLHIRS